MFLSRLSARERKILYAAILIIFAAVFDRFVLGPVMARSIRINREIMIEEKKVTKNLRNLAQKDRIAEEYKKYSTYAKTEDSDEEEIAKLLKEIEELARKSEIYVANVKPRSPKKIDFYKKYIVDMDAEGTIDQMINFIHNLHSSSQLLRVEKMMLANKRKGELILKSSMSITKIIVP